MQRRQRELDAPRDRGRGDRRSPELRDVAAGQPRLADSSIQRGAQQKHLDPSGDAGRRGQPCSSPLGGNAEDPGEWNRAEIPEHGRERHADGGVTERRPGVAKRVVGRGVETAERGCQQSDRRSRQNPPHVDRVAVVEPARLKQRTDDDVAEREKGDRGRHDEEGDAAKARVQTHADRLDRRGIGACDAGHGWQFRGRHRHAEQADRQRVERRRVLQSGDRAGAQPARDHLIDVRAHLVDAAADHNRQEVAPDRPHVRRRDIDGQMEIRRDLQHDRQLHEKLQRAADHRPPRQHHRQARQRRAGAKHDQRRDHRNVPDHAARIGQQEFVVAVQDPEAPCGQGEHAGGREQHAHDRDRQLALTAVKAWRNQVDEQGRGDHTDEHQHGHDQAEHGENGAGDAIRVAPFAARDERRVDGDERAGERAFAEQVLQEVGNLHRGVERVGGVASQTEVVREHALADEAGQAAEKDARGDEYRSPGSARAASGGARRSLSQDPRRAWPGRACRSTSSSGTT